MKKKKEKWAKRFLKWIAKGAAKEPPHCGQCKK
jgi:hypothetical protein